MTLQSASPRTSIDKTKPVFPSLTESSDVSTHSGACRCKNQLAVGTTSGLSGSAASGVKWYTTLSTLSFC